MMWLAQLERRGISIMQGWWPVEVRLFHSP